MSDELKAENEQLKAQALQNSQGVQSLLAQLDAHKQQMNESITAGLQLRSNLFLFQKAHKEQADHIATLNKQIESLNQQLGDATKRIAELETPAS